LVAEGARGRLNSPRGRERRGQDSANCRRAAGAAKDRGQGRAGKGGRVMRRNLAIFVTVGVIAFSLGRVVGELVFR
jgi:hypothetical protein